MQILCAINLMRVSHKVCFVPLYTYASLAETSLNCSLINVYSFHFGMRLINHDREERENPPEMKF